MIARQAAALHRSSVIAIHVSPEDFPDAAALAGLSDGLAAERAAHPGLIVPCVPMRSAIECRLGQIDLDLRTQWQALSAPSAPRMAG